jgi:hypothetical protein
MVAMDIVLGDALFNAVVCAANSPQLAYWVIHDIARKMSIEEFFHKFSLYDIVEPTIECSLRRQGIPALAVSKVDLKELVEKLLALRDKLNAFADKLRHADIDVDKLYKLYS